MLTAIFLTMVRSIRYGLLRNWAVGETGRGLHLSVRWVTMGLSDE